MTLWFSCRAREVTCHYGHVNRFCYLLARIRGLAVFAEFLADGTG